MYGCSFSAQRRAVHRGSQNAVNAYLVASAVDLQPLQHVRVKADGELLLGQGPCFRCRRKERLVERRNVQIVDSLYRNLRPPCRGTGQHALGADVFIEVRPARPLAVADDFEVNPLLRSGLCEQP